MNIIAKGKRTGGVIILLHTFIQLIQGSHKLTFGVILPDTAMGSIKRNYTRTVNNSIKSVQQSMNITSSSTSKGTHFTLHWEQSYLKASPNPLDILNVLCHQFSKDVMAILYFTNGNGFGNNVASSQYLLQLTEYVGIPVIAWNAENIGVQKRFTESNVLHLAPSIEHQLSALLSILKRYSWHKFSVVTSQVNGYDDFVRAVRAQVVDSTDFQFTIIDIFTLKGAISNNVSKKLESLAKSEARIILLYCNGEESEYIMAAAEKLKITGKNYVWLVTQAVLGTTSGVRAISFPPGMLGVRFDSSRSKLLEEIDRAIEVFFKGFDRFAKDPLNMNSNFSPNLNCISQDQTKWSKGALFFKHLRDVNKSKPNQTLAFNADGTLKYANIEIVNLNKKRIWDAVGTWTNKGLFIKDIVWPGNATKPPAGVPEKFNLKVTFMDEPPYITIEPPDNETGECKTQRAVKCRTTKSEIDKAENNGNNSSRNYMCCAGFCIDLLQKFANDLGFTYDLYKVEDGKWGALHNGTWNGLISDLLKKKADIVVTSIKINSERQSAVDFTVPFLETGIAIVVAKRTGIISPKAFLEPFDTISWIMILFICIQVSAFAIFLFEWLSPSGYNMSSMPPRGKTYWLVWAILFGAAVNVDCPRGYTARFMSNVWAMFAVVFLAIYTANLAAFMITREEYYNLSGIEDKRLQYPKMMEPPFRYGTIPHGNTESVLKRNKIGLYLYMKKHNRPSVNEGIRAVKMGELDAFIYDSTVLEYWVGQDNECRLLTVGSWYAMTGYGFALPKKSKYLNMFNREMIRYRENGDLERLQRFWLQGACKPTKSKRNMSKPLDINQFMSAFLLLGCGVLLTIFLLGVEHMYYRYLRKHLPKKDKGGCFTLISLSIGKSLSFRGAVFEAQDMLKHHRCKDPVCDTQLWKAKHELDMAQLKIRNLEAQIEGREPDENYFHSRHTRRKSQSSSEIYTRAPPRYEAFCKTPSIADIDEIETVL